VSSARGLLAGLAGPIGLGLTGVSLDQLGVPLTVAALAGWMLLMTCVAAFSRAIREA
jgi:hypothetical protein